MANHTILGGKVHIYKRPNSRFWQCCTWLAGRNRRTTTKQESHPRATRCTARSSRSGRS